jgi:hypothetical protein
MPKNMKRTQRGKTDPASYSFTEPVLRVRSDPAKKNSKLHGHHKVKPSQGKGTKARFDVFHKREDKSNGTDIIGQRSLSVWKKSSGRSKSWRNCKRLKVTQDDVDLLIHQKGHPVSLGWRFSRMEMPSSFVRSQGVRITREARTRKKTPSSIKTFEGLDEEYSRDLLLPRGVPPDKWRSFRKLQNLGAARGLSQGFIRLTINSETVNITSEEFLREIRFSTRQLLPFSKKENPKTTTLGDLIVLDLLHNESHADVYLVQDAKNLSKLYHAHAFLSDGLSGNWPTFMRRKMDRLRRSRAFHAETIQFGRKIIVMRAESEADEGFHIKDMEREFPRLSRTGEAPFQQDLVLMKFYYLLY